MSNIDTFLKMIEQGNDNALLRFSLGNEYLKIEDYINAIEHLNMAVEMDQTYSAAWKQYAKALTANNQIDAAMNAYQQGITIAEKNGDKQAVKEMQVFLKRLQNN